MNRVWEQSTVEPRQARWSGMYVTMTKTGVIFLSAKVVKALEGSERYLLLFDRTNNSIGLQPTNSMTPNSRKAGAKGKKGGQMIRAYSLMQEFGIKLNYTVKFLDPKIENGVLVLDLRETSPLRPRARA